MSFLDSIMEVYFLLFLTILPMAFVAATTTFLINKKKFNVEKLGVKNTLIICIFASISLLCFFAISAFVMGYSKIVKIISQTAYYFICFALVIFMYLSISLIENIAKDPQKCMKAMSNNLSLSFFKDCIIRISVANAIKIYIFICYLVAIVLFQLESMGIYSFENGFISTIVNVCQNSITIILAFELILKYKQQKSKEIDGLKKGTELFQDFFDISVKYLNLYNWFADSFEPILYKEDSVFYSKVPELKNSLQNKLKDIRKDQKYQLVKVSSKIKTYDIIYNTLIECIKSYVKNNEQTIDKKKDIVYIILYFQHVVKNEITFKSKKSFINKLNKYKKNKINQIAAVN